MASARPPLFAGLTLERSPDCQKSHPSRAYREHFDWGGTSNRRAEHDGDAYAGY